MIAGVFREIQHKPMWQSRYFVGLNAPLVPLIILVSATFSSTYGEQPTSLTRLRNDARDLLKAEATAQKSSQKDAAVAALCDMYVILRSDQRYESSTMLQADAAKIRRRLLTVAQKRKAGLRREKVERPDSLAAEIDESIASAVHNAEQGRRLRAGGGGVVADEGWRLVELIERVIAPQFWEARGGPGAVYYFATRRVLVVRATSDVHEQIKDLLTALR